METNGKKGGPDTAMTPENYEDTSLSSTLADTALVKKELCDSCKQLNLAAGKFIVKNGSTTPDDLNGHITDDSFSAFSLKSRNGKQSLGTLRLILSRSASCPFCSLVRTSIKPPKGETYEAYLDAQCDMNWELDGREVTSNNDFFQTRTRRIHLRWDDQRLQDAYLVFVAPERFLRFSSDASGAWEKESFFLGRNIDSGSNHFLMKSWVDSCSQDHKYCFQDPDDSAFDRMARQSFFGVIDVLDFCLKPLPRAESTGYYEPYIALSYVWGHAKPYTTTLENILIHMVPGSLAKSISEMPRVIQDAMNLARLLGKRYLWVDSLCIVQDSNRSWNLNADVMDLIYGQAFLTICAADGDDSQTGLRAMNPESRSASQHIEECAPGLSLMLRELPETSISVSTWNTRAWTFQERLLSRRCLIFADGRAFFQCPTNAMSEDVVAVKKGAGWSLDLVQALPQILRELPYRGFRVYMNCVSLYSSKALTKSKDILAAFKGVSNLIGQSTGTPFVYGLPNSHFDLALLWEPARALKRRIPRTADEKRDFQDMSFPSWSWCGWENGEIRYTDNMIEGCLGNVHEWIQEHTWISWYIRDGHGDLRPLWHPDMLPTDGLEFPFMEETEERWQGYNFPLQKNYNNPSRAIRRENHLERRAPTSSYYEVSPPRARDRREYGFRDDYEISRRKKQREREQEEYAKRAHEEALRKERRERAHEEALRKERRNYDREYEREEERKPPVIVNNHVDNYYDEDPRPQLPVHQQKGPEIYKQPSMPRREDVFGRYLHPEFQYLPADVFFETLPENPYQVVISLPAWEPKKEFADQPILQFWTWMASLHLVSKEKGNELLGDGLVRCDIADHNGDWCGSIVLDEEWVKKASNNGVLDTSRYTFIALSDAKAFTQDECEIWTYYITSERRYSEWDLYYVLLVEKVHPIWHRVGLGKVFKAAFSNAGKAWKEIILG